MKGIILASKSPYRKELLQRLGIEFQCIASQVDENKIKAEISDPIELTQKLSVEKAMAIVQEHPDSIVIGSDQVCHFKGEILGKAKTHENAFIQMSKLNGNMHELITSYAIVHKDTIIIKTDTTKLYMRNLTENQIKNYLRTDNPIDCAGSYKLELNGISLFRKIETEDNTAIIGLPLISLSNELNKLGIVIPPEN
jgi:septum formation protein